MGFRRGSRRRERAMRAQAETERNQAWTDSYAALTRRIRVVRRAVVADPRHPMSLADQRAQRQLLISLLGEAVGRGFAADAAGAQRPLGTPSWAAEGLARSTEREAAIFAALDAGR